MYGKLLPARASLERGGLPIGLAHGVTLTRAVKQSELVRWADVTAPTDSAALRLRRTMEARARAGTA